MAEEKKHKAVKHIEEFFQRSKKVNKIIDTTTNVHTEAYQSGLSLDEMRDEEGNIDYKKLNDEGIQDKFLEKMVDTYLEGAVKDLKLKEKPEDYLEQDRVLQAYIGVTRSELKKKLRKDKSKYTQVAHEELRDKLIKAQKEKLFPLRAEHFEDKHINDILEHTGADLYLNSDNIISVNNVVPFLDLYKEKKGEKLTLADLKALGIPEQYFNDKAKKKLKEMDEKEHYQEPANAA